MTRPPSRVTQAELEAAFAAGVNANPYIDPNVGSAYLRYVINFAHRWFRGVNAVPSNHSPTSVRLVFPEYPNRVSDTAQIFGFCESFDTEHRGQTYICNESLSEVRQLLNVPSEAMNAATHLVDIGLGTVPAVVLTPGLREVAVYPNGFRTGEVFTIQDVGIVGPAVLDPDVLVDRIRRFWDATIAVPNRAVRIWEDYDNWIAVGQAERNIQLVLAPQLDVVYRDNFNVHPEVVTASGRADIVIYPRENLGSGTATIELKAMCSRRKGARTRAGYRTESARTHAHAVEKGVTQVVNAKQRLSATVAILACFDLRMIDKRVDHVTRDIISIAKRHGITIEVLPLYQSMDQRRRAEQAATS